MNKTAKYSIILTLVCIAQTAFAADESEFFTKAQFMADQKVTWEGKGWKWNPEVAGQFFSVIDTNSDGIATDEEKKAYWADPDVARAKWEAAAASKKESASTTNTTTATTAAAQTGVVKVPTGERPKGVEVQTYDEFLVNEKQKWAENGWNWNQAEVDGIFERMDTNRDGYATGLERKIYWEWRMKQ